MEHLLFWMIPVSSLLALLLAWYFYRQMMKESEGRVKIDRRPDAKGHKRRTYEQ